MKTPKKIFPSHSLGFPCRVARRSRAPGERSIFSARPPLCSGGSSSPLQSRPTPCQPRASSPCRLLSSPSREKRQVAPYVIIGRRSFASLRPREPISRCTHRRAHRCPRGYRFGFSIETFVSASSPRDTQWVSLYRAGDDTTDKYVAWRVDSLHDDAPRAIFSRRSHAMVDQTRGPYFFSLSFPPLFSFLFFLFFSFDKLGRFLLDERSPAPPARDSFVGGNPYGDPACKGIGGIGSSSKNSLRN